MPKRESEFSDRYLSFPSVNFDVENSIPINILENVADAHASEMWGKDIARGPPIPVADKKGDLLAYIFPYIIGRRLFPEYVQILKKVKSVRSRSQEISSTPVPQPVPLPYSEFEQEVGRYGSIYVSARRTNFPILRVTHSLHPFFLSRQIAQETAEDHLSSKEVRLRTIYFLGPHEEYFEFASEQSHTLIHINSLERKKPEDILIHEPVVTTIPLKVRKQIEKSWERAIELTPEGIDADEVSITHTKKLIPHWELVPVIDWTCWCHPTAYIMVLGFWDNYVKGKGTIIGYGRLIDHWLEHVKLCKPNYTGPNPMRNVPNLIDKIIDPKTGTWSKDPIKKLKYNFSDKEVYADASNDWAWNDLKQEIDNGRPLKWNVYLHGMTAFGYRINSLGKYVILYTTWGSTSQQQLEEWNYTLCTGIQCVYPGGGTNGDHAVLQSPVGGEALYSSVPSEILWYVWGNVIKKTDISVSNDGGKSWTSIATGIDTQSGLNRFIWIPKETSKGRVRIKTFTTAGEYIAGDGSRQMLDVEGTGIGYQWKKISGPVGTVVAGYDKLNSREVIYATDPDTGDIYDYSPKGEMWFKVGDPCKMLAMDGQGRLYGLSPDGSSVLQYSGLPMQWKKIGGAAKAIYGDIDGVCAINPQTGDIYRYGPPWIKVGGPGKAFAFDVRGYLYGVSPDESGLWRYTGLFGPPTQWVKIAGEVAMVYARGNAVYAIKPVSGNIYLFLGKPFKWVKIGGPGKMFAVDCQGRIYGLSPDGIGVWRYDGSYDNPTKWTLIGGAATKIYGGWKTVLATSPKTNDLMKFE